MKRLLTRIIYNSKKLRTARKNLAVKTTTIAMEPLNLTLPSRNPSGQQQQQPTFRFQPMELKEEDVQEQQHYDLDLSNVRVIGDYRLSRQPLDEIMALCHDFLSLELQEAITPKFEPNNFCPTPWLKDVSPTATLQQPKYLDYKNAHPNDSAIQFVDEPHKYFLNGNCDNIISATTFIGCFFPSFDRVAAAQTTLNSKSYFERKNQPSYKYCGCQTMQDIWDKWDENARKGTELHANIESFFNQEPFHVQEYNQEPFRQFQKLFSDRDWVRWEPFRTEWSVYCPETRICGQIDFAGMIDPKSKRLVLIDWKRTQNITFRCFNRFQGRKPKTGYGPCQEIDSCNGNKYYLQLNLYKYIIEKYYGYYVQKM